MKYIQYRQGHHGKRGRPPRSGTVQLEYIHAAQLNLTKLAYVLEQYMSHCGKANVGR